MVEGLRGEVDPDVQDESLKFVTKVEKYLFL